VKDSKSKPPSGAGSKDNGESANRRRLGRVVHDDRGQASVEWNDAPENYVRPVLELEDTGRAQTRLKSARDKEPYSPGRPERDAFNPYQRSVLDAPSAGGPKRDLRKLSKWIKMMREVEERKVLDKNEAEKPTED
jgi:hypothetical protein